MTAPLHPRGTLRARFEGASGDAVFRRLGLGARRCDLGDEGLYLAEEIVGADKWFGGADPDALGILVLALMIAQRQGSTRLPLDAGPKTTLRGVVADILRVAGVAGAELPRVLGRIKDLVSTPGFNAVIGTGDARRPLVVDDGCLYSERARTLEVRVAERIAARMLEPAVVASTATATASKLTAEQQRAVDIALAGTLSVVTGGPGTGKTFVAAAIVRGFVARGIEHVALSAPTGKAANRLTEVMARELAGTGVPAPVAQTLHRLLGYRGHGGFAHHARSPLPIGALIVDEASMLDLELVDALLDALPKHAPLVLIGDANQLPAVDAGRILADLADPDGAATERVGRLEHSHRMDAADPRGRAVLEAARAIHAGDASALVDKVRPLAQHKTPGTLGFAGVEWVDVAIDANAAASAIGRTAREVAIQTWHHFDGAKAQATANTTVFRFENGAVAPDQAEALERLWQLAGRARILTATRGLPTGSLALNAHLHDHALSRMTVTGKPELVPGEPIMMTANDYQRGLFNGDQGIVIRADEGLGGHRYRALFRVAGRLQPFAIEALRDRLELAWALTIHKSQGSELDAVAIVLPEDDLPLVTRELLYTGVTRARESVVLCGARAVLVAGAKRVAMRHSGLGSRIRATLRG
ncbi:MAG TPA: exodeoxyribonuclease V subunit alpha [Kofleriaceae bacterium]|nr:exodeoxyribonuclease V subunit alpha [Kofleriaceae bacterium]